MSGPTPKNMIRAARRQAGDRRRGETDEEYEVRVNEAYESLTGAPAPRVARDNKPAEATDEQWKAYRARVDANEQLGFQNPEFGVNKPWEGTTSSCRLGVESRWVTRQSR